MTECQCRPWNHQERGMWVCVCATQWCFSICLAKTLSLQHWHRQYSEARTRRDSRWPKADWNSLWMETKMEWTLCCWILVKGASQVCDSVINLKKLQRGKPILQNCRLLIENARAKTHVLVNRNPRNTHTYGSSLFEHHTHAKNLRQCIHFVF